MLKGPIVIIEDDPDDQDLYSDSIRHIGVGNEIKFFGSGDDALEYLSSTEEQPFI
ncbi:MAG: response regulator, partial [Chitinophagaceae bacterium]